MAESDGFSKNLSGVLSKADSLRAAGLRGLAAVTLARQGGLAREHGRLTQERGPNHPRTLAVAARLADGALRLRDLNVEVARAETVAPEPDPDGWILHGYVWGADRQPVSALRVSMVDTKGDWIRSLGTADTDDRGYFRMVAEEVPATSGKTLTGRIVLSSKDGAEVHRDESVVTIAAGRIEYHELTLESEAGGGEAGDGNAEAKASKPRRTRRK